MNAQLIIALLQIFPMVFADATAIRDALAAKDQATLDVLLAAAKTAALGDVQKAIDDLKAAGLS